MNMVTMAIIFGSALIVTYVIGAVLIWRSQNYKWPFNNKEEKK